MHECSKGSTKGLRGFTKFVDSMVYAYNCFILYVDSISICHSNGSTALRRD